MKYDFIAIISQGITGVKNPLLQIVGSIEVEDYKFVLYIDGKQTDYEFRMILGADQFVLEKELTEKDKKIELRVIVDGKEYVVSKLKNRKFSRINNKIKGRLKKHFKKAGVVFGVLGRGIKHMWKEYHFLIPVSLWGKYLKELKTRIRLHDSNSFYNPFNTTDYNDWLKKHEKFEEKKELKYKPLISIVIPVYNIGKKYLSACIDSILEQTYDNYEICLVDDCSSKKETKDTLKEYEKKDKRIKVKYRKKNGHISRATNDAIEMATGEFIALMDNDDTLSPHALYEMVKVLNDDKKIDMIYSDEDKLDLNGRRCDPNFKSDFAPDSLLSSNYICHFTMLRKSIIDEIKGFRVGYEGAQDYDLFLRFTEKTDKIYHIPKILYHWRMVEGSTSMVIDNKNYALECGKKALEDALKRRKIKGKVKISKDCPYYYIEYDVVKDPKVSIIIPTKDLADTTRTCLESVYEKTTYKNYEVIVVNNNSEKKETFKLFDEYKKKHDNFKVIDANFEFNYSKINNLAVSKTKSDYIVLLNNDIEVITPNWLEIMLGYASQDHIGAVGAKLLYPDDTVQHGGVVLGLGGVASHTYVGVDRDSIVWGGRLSVPYNYSAVTAACLMVSRKKYDEVKGLDEELQVAYNDIDFNIRLLKKGYYNVFVPMAELYHYESKSRGRDTTKEKYKRFKYEVNIMTDKWKKELLRDRFYNPNFSLRRDFMLDKKENK